MELITAAVIAILLITGFGIHHFSAQPNSAAEQIVEQALRFEGINIDFSAGDANQANTEK